MLRRTGSAFFHRTRLKRQASIFVATAVWLSSVPVAGARTWRVNAEGSGDATAIQAGIELASPGDTVLVAPRTYFESIVLDRNILLASEAGAPWTTIDAQGLDRVVVMTAGVLQGFTIRNGQSPLYFSGGGIYAPSTAHFVQIEHCIIEDNSADWGDAGLGGGIYAISDSSLIQWNIVRNNGAGLQGGGIYASGGPFGLEGWAVVRKNLAGCGKIVSGRLELPLQG